MQNRQSFLLPILGVLSFLTIMGTDTFGSKADSAPSIIDLRAIGAHGNGVDDDSRFLKIAFELEQKAIDSGNSLCVFASSGRYLIKSEEIPPIRGPLCLRGEGSLITNFILDKDYSGTLIRIEDAWSAGNSNVSAADSMLERQKGGAHLTGFSIIADRSTKMEQNGIVFYDRTDFAYIEDVEVRSIAGTAIALGERGKSETAFFQESRISNLRLFNDGTYNKPVFHITASGPRGSEGTGEIELNNIDIYANYGDGIRIDNRSDTHLADLWFDRLRIEGIEYSIAPSMPPVNLIAIGAQGATGVIDSLTFSHVELLDPYKNAAAFRVASPSVAAMPYNIYFDGVIGGGNPRGDGLVIDAGRSLRFAFQDIYTLGKNLIVGSSPLVGGEISICGPFGRDRRWSRLIDSKVNSFVEIERCLQ